MWIVGAQRHPSVMSPELIVSIAAAAIALLSAAFAGASVRQAKRSADAAEAQVAGMRESNIAVAQPYVWADVRGGDVSTRSLQLVVGNSGPTVAQDVRVVFSPPLPLGGAAQDLTGAAMKRLESGGLSLAPGRVLSWGLGPSPEILESDSPQVHRVQIDASGPFGSVETLTYEIDLSDIRESLDQPVGSLYALSKSVDKVAAALKKQP